MMKPTLTSKSQLPGSEGHDRQDKVGPESNKKTSYVNQAWMLNSLGLWNGFRNPENVDVLE